MSKLLNKGIVMQSNNKKLLQPIAKNNLTGINIRLKDSGFQNQYYDLKLLRAQARSLEKQSYESACYNPTVSDWESILKQVINLLQKTTKDVELLCWYIEAKLRVEGLNGLVDALTLVIEFAKNDWNQIHPKQDEDGEDVKLGFLMALTGDDIPGSLILPLNNIVITDNEHSGNYTLCQYQQAVALENVSDPVRKENRAKILEFDLNQIKQSISSTNPNFYESLSGLVNQAIEKIIIIENKLSDLYIDTVLSFENLTSALTSILEHIDYIKNDITTSLICEDTYDKEESFSIKKPLASDVWINNRLDALNQIQMAANYFKKYEPHSPLPSILERAVKWGNMSLHELLNETIQEEHTKENLIKFFGIQF